MQPMNININSSQPDSNNIDNSQEDYSEFQKYIIKNNINLTNENKQLRERIVELEKQNLEHENENDKYDERIRYMRGLLHNLYSLKELSNTIREDWEKCANNYNKLFNKYIIVEKYISKTIKIYFVILIFVCTFEHFIFGAIYIFIKIVFYNIVTLLFMYVLISKKYIFNNNTFKFTFENNNINLKFFENIRNILIIQSDLIKNTNEKIKEINELEKACVGVSVMIDNI